MRWDGQSALLVKQGQNRTFISYTNPLQTPQRWWNGIIRACQYQLRLYSIARVEGSTPSRCMIRFFLAFCDRVPIFLKLTDPLRLKKG